MRPADFGTRFTAWMIDAAALFALQWIVVLVASRQLQAAGMVDRGPCDVDAIFVCEGPSTSLWVLLFAFVVVTTFGSHVWFDGMAGATPGKRWMGVQVVHRGAADGEPIGARRGVIRAVIRQGIWIWTFLFLAASPIAVDLPSPLFFAAFGLSALTFIWGAYAPNGSALHDLAASTSVVAASSIPSPPVAEPIEATP